MNENGIPFLDSSGKICPLPVLRLRKAMSALQAGQRIQTRTTDPLALIDVPAFCDEAGHVLIAAVPDGNGILFTIEYRGR